MLIIFNNCSVINTENVCRMTTGGEVISFYLTSGESYHFAFENAAKMAQSFEHICRCYSMENKICRVDCKG